MKLLTYEYKRQVSLGVLCGSKGRMVLPLSELGIEYRDMNDLIDNITEEERKKIREAAEAVVCELRDQTAAEDMIPLKLSEVKLRSPIIHPKQDVICLGINYADHAVEAGNYSTTAFGGERPYPIYFSKRVNEAVGDGEDIQAHDDIVDSLDYEAELAVIIGRPARNVSMEDALDYVFGYAVLNDISARNIQTRHKQWYFGKSLDAFTPIGPWITTSDELDPGNLAIRSFVNGELRQDGNTNQLIFNVPYIISELSSGMTLLPGTIIATGTPAGVGMGFEPPKFMSPGDVVACEIEGIGKITNRVK